MRAVVVGSGGREHALSSRLAREGCEVFAIPGNAGISSPIKRFPGISPEDPQKIRQCVEGVSPDLVVIGPEAPLVNGVADLLRESGWRVFGPSLQGARLEGSKVFAKEFMERRGIPTAPFEVAGDLKEVERIVGSKSRRECVVVKADGLRGGKGVVIVRDPRELPWALNRLRETEPPGGERYVVEGFLAGEEMSFHVLMDESGFYPLLPSQDHKTIDEFDLGPNTGGMGAYAPTSLLTRELEEKIIRRIVLPVWEGLREEGIPYRGVLYCGLMIVEGDPYVLEFNVRFGDPECQAILGLLQGNLGEILLAVAEGRLREIPPPSFEKGYALDLVLAGGGYPGSPWKGIPLSLPKTLPPGIELYFAGVEEQEGVLVTSGGRVLHILARAPTLESAYTTAYSFCERVRFPTCHYRRDIGLKELLRTL